MNLHQCTKDDLDSIVLYLQENKIYFDDFLNKIDLTYEKNCYTFLCNQYYNTMLCGIKDDVYSVEQIGNVCAIVPFFAKNHIGAKEVLCVLCQTLRYIKIK